MNATARITRLGAWGAVLALTGYVLLPTLRTVVEAVLGTGDDSVYPLPSEIPEHEWWGIAGAVIFLIIAAGILMLTVGAVALVRERGAGPMRELLGFGLGLGGVLGFVLSAAGSRTMYSFIAANLVETGADPGAQVAALWAVNIANGSALIVAGVMTSAFLAWLAANRVVGRAVGIVIVVLAAIVVFGEVGPVILGAQFAFIPVFAVLAIALFLQARRKAESEHAR